MTPVSTNELKHIFDISNCCYLQWCSIELDQNIFLSICVLVSNPLNSAPSLHSWYCCRLCFCIPQTLLFSHFTPSLLHSQATKLKKKKPSVFVCVCVHVCVRIKQELNPFRLLRFRGQVSFMSPPRSMDVTSDCTNLYINMALANHSIAWDGANQWERLAAPCSVALPSFVRRGLVPWQRWSPGRWVSQSSGTRTETDHFIPSVTSSPGQLENRSVAVGLCVSLCGVQLQNFHLDCQL